jgi:hypothetical protein
MGCMSFAMTHLLAHYHADCVPDIANLRIEDMLNETNLGNEVAMPEKASSRYCDRCPLW